MGICAATENAEAIDQRRSTSRSHARVNFHVAVDEPKDRGVDQVCNRETIVLIDDLLAVPIDVLPHVETQHSRYRRADRRELRKSIDINGRQERLPGHIEPNKSQILASLQHALGRLRVEPDVELRVRRHVPTVRRATHHDDASERGEGVWSKSGQEGNIR